MKLDKHLQVFPHHLPNDLEGLFYSYPSKFPKIVSEYIKAVKTIGADPKAFRAYVKSHNKDLFAGFNKIKKDYDAEDQKDLRFLVEIDQRLQRLVCFRFWTVNYLFPDGPVHEFYVDKLAHYSRRLVEVEEKEVDDYEHEISVIQRDLTQTDYADLYLQNTLHGIKIIELLRKNKMDNLIDSINSLVYKGERGVDESHKLLDPIIEQAYSKDSVFGKKLAKHLAIMLQQAEMRKTRMPIYNVLIHAMEFEDQNIVLEERHKNMTKKIKDLIKLGKKKFSKNDAEELEVSYKMIRNFAETKDIMGEIDGVLLPMWFGLLEKARELLLKQNPDFKKLDHNKSIGPGSMFYYLGWFLPDDLKVLVYTPDLRNFSLKDL